MKIQNNNMQCKCRRPAKIYSDRNNGKNTTTTTTIIIIIIIIIIGLTIFTAAADYAGFPIGG